MNVLRIVQIALFAGPLLGQTVPRSEPTQTEREIREIRDRYVNEARREAIKSVQTPIGLNRSGTARLKKSIDQFSTATAAYRTAVDSKTSLDQPLKNIEKALGDLENYFKTPISTKVNKAAFDKLSPMEFAAETLKSADRLKADLPALVILSEDPYLLRNPEARQFLLDVNQEASLLKYLASKSRPARAK
jgi:hypothetical protein